MTRPELTYEEFCFLPLVYTKGITTDRSASRLYRNNEHGLQREVHTMRKKAGDIYSGWKEGKVSYFLDGDEREFSNLAELYVAYMEKVCGAEA